VSSDRHGTAAGGENGIVAKTPDLVERYRRVGVTDVVSDLPPDIVRKIVRYPERETADHWRADDLDRSPYPRVWYSGRISGRSSDPPDRT